MPLLESLLNDPRLHRIPSTAKIFLLERNRHSPPLKKHEQEQILFLLWSSYPPSPLYLFLFKNNLQEELDGILQINTFSTDNTLKPEWFQKAEKNHPLRKEHPWGWLGWGLVSFFSLFLSRILVGIIGFWATGILIGSTLLALTGRALFLHFRDYAKREQILFWHSSGLKESSLQSIALAQELHYGDNTTDKGERLRKQLSHLERYRYFSLQENNQAFLQSLLRHNQDTLKEACLSVLKDSLRDITQARHTPLILPDSFPQKMCDCSSFLATTLSLFPKDPSLSSLTIRLEKKMSPSYWITEALFRDALIPATGIRTLPAVFPCDSLPIHADAPFTKMMHNILMVFSRDPKREHLEKAFLYCERIFHGSHYWTLKELTFCATTLFPDNSTRGLQFFKELSFRTYQGQGPVWECLQEERQAELQSYVHQNKQLLDRSDKDCTAIPPEALALLLLVAKNPELLPSNQLSMRPFTSRVREYIQQQYHGESSHDFDIFIRSFYHPLAVEEPLPDPHPLLELYKTLLSQRLSYELQYSQAPSFSEKDKELLHALQLCSQADWDALLFVQSSLYQQPWNSPLAKALQSLFEDQLISFSLLELYAKKRLQELFDKGLLYTELMLLKDIPPVVFRLYQQIGLPSELLALLNTQEGQGAMSDPKHPFSALHRVFTQGLLTKTRSSEYNPAFSPLTEALAHLLQYTLSPPFKESDPKKGAQLLFLRQKIFPVLEELLALEGDDNGLSDLLHTFFPALSLWKILHSPPYHSHISQYILKPQIPGIEFLQSLVAIAVILLTQPSTTAVFERQKGDWKQHLLEGELSAGSSNEEALLDLLQNLFHSTFPCPHKELLALGAQHTITAAILSVLLLPQRERVYYWTVFSLYHPHETVFKTFWLKHWSLHIPESEPLPHIATGFLALDRFHKQYAKQQPAPQDACSRVSLSLMAFCIKMFLLKDMEDTENPLYVFFKQHYSLMALKNPTIFTELLPPSQVDYWNMSSNQEEFALSFFTEREEGIFYPETFATLLELLDKIHRFPLPSAILEKKPLAIPALIVPDFSTLSGHECFDYTFNPKHPAETVKNVLAQQRIQTPSPSAPLYSFSPPAAASPPMIPPTAISQPRSLAISP
jgi:hypothetical protein